jgi:hypothetical protein
LKGGADLIDVGLRRPFYFKGFELACAARSVYNTESSKLDPIGSLLISDRWQTGIGEIGALVNVSSTQTRYLNSIGCQGFQDNVPAAQQILPASVGRDFAFLQHIRLFYNLGTCQRPYVNEPSKQSGRNDTDTAPTTSRADHRAPIANGPTFSLRSRPNMAGSPTRSRVSAKRLESLRLERRWACRRSACPRCYGVIARASDR